MPSSTTTRAAAATDSTVQADLLEPVAIIGFSMKFPQDATDADALWEMLMERRSAMTDIPADRFNVDGYYHPDPDKPGMINVRGGHMIKEDLTLFDAPFFSVAPAEASNMDPQQRWLLETSFRALENAGIPMEKVAGTKTSVHVGSWAHEYDSMFQRDPELQAKYRVTGTGNAMIANRLSWFFNLQGPSMAIDTACSSSLIALHLACQALRSGEASMGLVGGTSLFYHAGGIAPLSSLGFLSPDGISYSFDARANGYARGEGIGVLVVKLLSDALRDGDTIRAVVRATGTNQDGRTPGLTQPSAAAQERLIRDVYASAGLGFGETRFFEAHGTGTPVGDPLEAAAIAAVFGEERGADEPLFVGAIKSNIGHLEGASGIAGIIKTVLVLERGVIPPNMWFETPNPKIDPAWNLKFPTTPTPWPTDGLRRASVNSFGYGGSNAHAVLDDARHYLELRGLVGRHNTVRTPAAALESPSSRPSVADSGDEREAAGGSTILTPPASPTAPADGMFLPPSRPRLLVWSSHDEDGLRRLASAHEVYLQRKLRGLGHEIDDEESKDGQLLERFAYTLACKRSVFPWRSFAVAGGAAELLDRLSGGGGGGRSKPVRAGSATPRLGFIFTGQGAQWHAMGRELMCFPVYREAMVAANASLCALGCSWSLLDELAKDAKSTNIDRPDYSQPLCAAVQIALVDLLTSWRVRPVAVVGHSSGEIAAAYCAGAISAAEALRAAYFRGVLSAVLAQRSRPVQPCAGSSASPPLLGMMAVGLAEEDVRTSYLALQGHRFPNVVVACVNSPQNVTLAGLREELVALQAELKQAGVFCQLLRVENAYHSRFMEDIAPYYRACLGTFATAAVAVPEKRRKRKRSAETTAPAGPVMFSSVTGRRVSTELVRDGGYWVSNMVSPVLFSQALSEMLGSTDSTSAGVDYLVEIGPHGALRRSVREIIDHHKREKGAGGATGSISGKVAYDCLLTRNVSAIETALGAAGRLFCAGFSGLDFEAVNSASTGAGLPGKTTPRMLVDLPEYPFNHSQGYWEESRISRNVRSRNQPRLDFLGSRVADWNPAAARWRMYLRLSEHPWIRDHQITGKLLYPAAGMLVMALEAARELALDDGGTEAAGGDHGGGILGYRLKEIVFDKALIVPQAADGVEVQFHVCEGRNGNFGSGTAGGWRDFKLCSFDAATEKWIDHCRGSIRAERSRTPTTDAAAEWSREEHEREHSARRRRMLDHAREVERRCGATMDPGSLYEMCATSGLVFGPEFRTMTSIKYDTTGGSAKQQGAQREVVTRIRIRDAAGSHGHDQAERRAASAEHVIHPVTLDGILQTVFPALNASAGGDGPQLGAVVPSFVREMWISEDICRAGAVTVGTEPMRSPTRRGALRVCTAARRRGFREAECSVTVSDEAGNSLLAEMSGYRVTAVGGGAASGAAEGAWRRLCFNIDWKPDVDMLDLKSLPAWFFEPMMTRPPGPENRSRIESGSQALAVLTRQAIHTPPEQRYEDAEFVCFHFITTTLAAIDAGEITPLPAPGTHLAKYTSWMRHQVERLASSNYGGGVVHARREWEALVREWDQRHVREAMARLRGTPEGAVVLRVGADLRRVLSGEVDALDLLFGGADSVLQQHYRFGLGADRAYARIERWVDALAHKNPGLRVLEIGAGTGATTAPLLGTLGRHAVGHAGGEGEVGAPRFAEYTYTDISPGFFEKAKETFAEYASCMSFRVLDAERDVASQGFETGSYDLVVASNVIHATKDVVKTLANARRLLKPGGRLLLFELTNLNILRTAFSSGVLPGWWLGTEEHRRWGPLLEEADWDGALRKAGFSGNDITVRDWDEDRNHMTSVMVSTVPAAAKHQLAGPNTGSIPCSDIRRSTRTVIVVAEGSDTQRQTAKELKNVLRRQDSSASVSLRSVSDVLREPLDAATLCVFLPELHAPFLAALDEPSHFALKRVLHSGRLLWLTRAPCPATGDRHHDPAFDLVSGFARSVREETAGSMRFVTLALEDTNPVAVAERTARVITACFPPATSSSIGDSAGGDSVGMVEPEDEFVEKDGVLCIPRAVEANRLNDAIHRAQTAPRHREVQLQPLPSPTHRPLKLTIGAPGLLDTLRFVDDDGIEQTSAGLAADEVEIEVSAVGLNFFDVMTSLGQIPEDFFGGECAGVVSRVGRGVTNFRAGDRVFTGRVDAFKTRLRTGEALVQRVPTGWTLEEAAALPIVYGTCVYSLLDVARLRKGETVLIHSAAGGVGQAAIQIARMVGAEVLATVGTEEKKAFLVGTFGIPAENVFSSRDVDAFVLGVARATGGRGVDVVLNSLAGEALRATWRHCTAPSARFVELGKRDVQAFARLDMAPFARNVSFAAVDLFHPMRHDPRLMARIYGEVADLARAGKIRPPGPLHVFGAARVEDAFRLMQGGRHMGKIVVRLERGEQVPLAPDSRPPCSLDADATYVVAGGLGGLGRSIARWMVRRGARSLLLLSRSGLKASGDGGDDAGSPASKMVAELQAGGCHVAAPPCDISNAQSLSAVLAHHAKTTGRPIKGCVQAAMVLRDASAGAATLPGFRAALAPKVAGSRNLHDLLPRGMDFFVLLSSVAGVLGSHGQSNYAAGNTYQDALARHRVVDLGERAASLDLGLILSVGFVAERGGDGAVERMRARGYLPIREAELLALLDLHCDPSSSSCPRTALDSQVVTGIETPASLRRRGAEQPFAVRSAPLFRALHRMGVGRGGVDDDDDERQTAEEQQQQQQQRRSLAAELGRTKDLAEAGRVVADALAGKLARTLSIPWADVDVARPLHAFGVDSLVAVEVRSWLGREAGADVAVFELMGGKSVAALGELVAAKSRFVKTGASDAVGRSL